MLTRQSFSPPLFHWKGVGHQFVERLLLSKYLVQIVCIVTILLWLQKLASPGCRFSKRTRQKIFANGQQGDKTKLELVPRKREKKNFNCLLVQTFFFFVFVFVENPRLLCCFPGEGFFL